MDSSVITVQEAQTERDCRLQLIHAVNYVFHRKKLPGEQTLLLRLQL